MKKISYYLLKHRQLAILSLLLLLAEVREGVQLSFVTFLISMSKKKSYCAINDDLRLTKYFQQKSQSVHIENEILPVFHRDGDLSPTVASTTSLSRKIIFLRIPEYSNDQNKITWRNLIFSYSFRLSAWRSPTWRERTLSCKKIILKQNTIEKLATCCLLIKVLSKSTLIHDESSHGNSWIVLFLCHLLLLF